MPRLNLTFNKGSQVVVSLFGVYTSEYGFTLNASVWEEGRPMANSRERAGSPGLMGNVVNFTADSGPKTLVFDMTHYNFKRVPTDLEIKKGQAWEEGPFYLTIVEGYYPGDTDAKSGKLMITALIAELRGSLPVQVSKNGDIIPHSDIDRFGRRYTWHEMTFTPGKQPDPNTKYVLDTRFNLFFNYPQQGAPDNRQYPSNHPPTLVISVTEPAADGSVTVDLRSIIREPHLSFDGAHPYKSQEFQDKPRVWYNYSGQTAFIKNPTVKDHNLFLLVLTAANGGQEVVDGSKDFPFSQAKLTIFGGISVQGATATRPSGMGLDFMPVVLLENCRMLNTGLNNLRIKDEGTFESLYAPPPPSPPPAPVVILTTEDFINSINSSLQYWNILSDRASELLDSGYHDHPWSDSQTFFRSIDSEISRRFDIFDSIQDKSALKSEECQEILRNYFETVPKVTSTVLNNIKSTKWTNTLQMVLPDEIKMVCDREEVSRDSTKYTSWVRSFDLEANEDIFYKALLGLLDEEGILAGKSYQEAISSASEFSWF